MNVKSRVKILYIAGNEGAGKSPTCRNTKKLLESNNYKVTDMPMDFGCNDFAVHLCNQTNNVILCTASDSKEIIDELIKFYNQHTDSGELTLILAARNKGDPMRNYLESKLKKIVVIEEKVEIPLVRINGNAGKEVHDWYHKSVDELVKKILSENPFCLI